MSAASFSGAPPGSLGYFAPFDSFFSDELLNRAGKVMRALLSFWKGGDHHPTIDQIAELAKLPRWGVQRGLKDLSAAGKVLIEADLDHPVGRRIAPTGPLPIAPEFSSDGGSTSVGGSQFCDSKSATPYVLRDGIESLYVTRGGDNSATPPERITATLGRLESDPEEVELAVGRLVGEYGVGDDGKNYTHHYRKACRDVAEGRLAVAELIGAVEEVEAARLGGKLPTVANRRRAFVASVNRRRKRRSPVLPPVPEPAASEPLEVVAVETEPTPIPIPEEAVPAAPSAPKANDSETLARWDALPEADRSAIESQVRAENPSLGRWKNMLLPICLAHLAERDELPAVASASVEVLPTDAELGGLADFAFADHPIMRRAARSLVAEAGRDDIFRGSPPPTTQADRQPLRGLPVGSKSAFRTPG